MKAEEQTFAGWRNAKRARWHQQYRNRISGKNCMREDPSAVEAWLAAVERDDRSDPYSRAGGATR